MMNKLQKKRLSLIVIFSSGITLAVGLMLFSLTQNINVFLTPSQIARTHLASNYAFRLGGMVKKNSVRRQQQSLLTAFVVTDFDNDIVVNYNGVLPDLFREGKGVIAEGHLNATGTFIATQVLAKHDENYMPKNMLSLKERT
jgi:cytochrome c-type biogenesis protein CcmE